MESIVVVVFTMAADVGAGIGQRNKETKKKKQLVSFDRRELTFAGLHAFDPLARNVCVAPTATHIKPSATGSATTDSTRFLEGATLGTRHWRRN